MSEPNSLENIQADSNLENLWDKRRLAVFLGVSVQTVDYWTSTGRGGPRHIKIGRLVRFRPADVAAYVESCPSAGGSVETAATAREAVVA